MTEPVVGIIMGSSSDLPVMEQAAGVLTEFGIEHEVRVVSAHRSPLRMVEYARTARERGSRSSSPVRAAPPTCREWSPR